MSKIYFTLIYLFFSVGAYSQNATKTLKPDNIDKVMAEAAVIFTGKAQPQNSNKVYDYGAVEQQPEFPGGMAKFYAYVAKNFQYNYQEGDNIVSTIAYTFIVEKDGTLSNIKPKIELPKKIFDEVLRVLHNSPKWKPGLMNKKAVRVEYSTRMCILIREL